MFVVVWFQKWVTNVGNQSAYIRNPNHKSLLPISSSCSYIYDHIFLNHALAMFIITSSQSCKQKSASMPVTLIPPPPHHHQTPNTSVNCISGIGPWPPPRIVLPSCSNFCYKTFGSIWVAVGQWVEQEYFNHGGPCSIPGKLHLWQGGHSTANASEPH